MVYRVILMALALLAYFEAREAHRHAHIIAEAVSIIHPEVEVDLRRGIWCD